jgi:gliding motility-associated-like protein
MSALKKRSTQLGFALLFLFLGKGLLGQYSLTPQLIGTAGLWSTAGNYSLSASVGEVLIPTWSSGSSTLTQGFQQPSGSLLVLASSVSATTTSCADATDAQARALPIGGNPPYSYTWSTGATTAVADGLAPGTYTVQITDAAGLQVSDTVQVTAGTEICGIHFFTGITPNGDGNNDFWTIEFIELYQPNSVAIFNRWGETVWSATNYNNQTVRWEGLDKNGNAVPAGTYFYLVEVNGKTSKGWVEVTQ